MSLTPSEAAQSLREVTDTEKRSTELFRYRHSAPFFFWWGAYWVAGYGATALWPWRAGIIWIGLSVLAIAGHFAIVNVTNQRRNWRWGAISGILSLFVLGMFALMWPYNGLKIGAFFPMLMGTLYACAGVFFGARFIVTGMVVMAATMIGFFFLREYFAIWMAIFGGGALILTGLWLRKA